MALVQGYLMGLFLSEKVLLDGEAAEEVHQLAGTEGVSGQFSNVLSLDWWDLTEGAGSIDWGANYGYNDLSGGCAITATAAVDTYMGQTVTYSVALAEEKKLSLKLWAKLTSGKEATLTVTFKNAAGATIGTPDVLTMVSNQTGYGDGNWGYWSLYLTMPVLTKSYEFVIAPTSAQTMYIDDVRATSILQVIGAYDTLSIALEAEVQDISTFKSLQDNSGFRSFGTSIINAGEMTVSNFWGVKNWWSSTTTYAVGDVVQNDERSYTCILASTNNEPPNATYWTILGAEEMSYAMLNDERVFAILFVNVTHGGGECWQPADSGQRWEFWAYVPKSGIVAPLSGKCTNPFTLKVDGIVGFVDRAAD